MNVPEEIPQIKPAKTFEEQLDILIARGLIVEDKEWALEILQRISYYRLTGFLIEYKDGENAYKQGTSLRQIYKAYEFDALFRNSLLGILESLEISLRTKLAYFMAHAFGPLGYQDREHFANEKWHSEHLEKLESEISRSAESFASHYREKYRGIFPIWVASEMMSFGTLSKLYSNMHRSHKNDFSKYYYDLDESILKSWLTCLVNVRNTCAHFARIYGRPLRFPLKIHKQDREFISDPASMFAALMAARRIYEPRQEWLNFVTRLFSLIEEFADYIDVAKLGFPEEWERALRTF